MLDKKKEQNQVIKKPTRGFSSKTNTIIGVLFILFVMICFVIRFFVG